MISIWPTRGGLFQANVSEQGDNSWTTHTDADPMAALGVAMRHRIAGAPSRKVTRSELPIEEQIDIEDAIAAAKSVSYTEQSVNNSDDDEDLIG